MLKEADVFLFWGRFGCAKRANYAASNTPASEYLFTERWRHRSRMKRALDVILRTSEGEFRNFCSQSALRAARLRGQPPFAAILARRVEQQRCRQRTKRAVAENRRTSCK